MTMRFRGMVSVIVLVDLILVDNYATLQYCMRAKYLCRSSDNQDTT